MASALKALTTLLAAAPTLQGASVLFGEENVNAQDQSLPYVCIVPVGGGWGPPGVPGYFKGADPDIQNIWMTQENVDLYLWAASIDDSALPVDHAEAVENFRARVLQALQFQALTGPPDPPGGFKFEPRNGRWVPMQGAQVRYGRCYVLTVQVDISVSDVAPVDSLPPHTLTLNATI